MLWAQIVWKRARRAHSNFTATLGWKYRHFEVIFYKSPTRVSWGAEKRNIKDVLKLIGDQPARDSADMEIDGLQTAQVAAKEAFSHSSIFPFKTPKKITLPRKKHTTQGHNTPYTQALSGLAESHAHEIGWTLICVHHRPKGSFAEWTDRQVQKQNSGSGKQLGCKEGTSNWGYLTLSWV